MGNQVGKTRATACRNPRYTSREMKLAAFLSLLIVLVASAAAQSSNRLCPTIEVTGPSKVTNPGDTMTFAVALHPSPADVKYMWKVSRGVIESGQGTHSIVVRTIQADGGQQIVATVAFEGLPLGCKAVDSESGPVAEPPPNCIFMDEYSNEKLSKADQRDHLDVFFSELSNVPEHAGMFILRTAPQENKDSTSKRINFILNHAKYRRFNKNRLVFAIESYEYSSTIPVRIPPGGDSPCKDCKLVYGRDLK